VVFEVTNYGYTFGGWFVKTQTTDMGTPREPDPIVSKSSVFFGTNATRVTVVQFDEE
jgi:hypothetical protein